MAPSTWIAPAPIGPVRPGSLAEKIATSGTPSAAARCSRPVSTPTTNAAPAISRATASSGARSGTRARGVAAAIRDARSRSASVPNGTTRSTSGPERGREHPPVRLRPFLVGARGRVQQHAIGRSRGFGQRRAVEAEIRRTVRRVAQRRAGQRAVSRNRVLFPFHRMAHVIERAGERLLDAVGIVAVAAAPRRARDQRRLEEQALRVDDCVIGAAAKPAHETCRSPARSKPAIARGASSAPRPGSPPPTAGCSRTSGANASSTTQAKRASGRSRAGLRQRRHVMDHVAERGGLDEKHIGHGAFVQMVRAPYTRH